MQLNAYSGRLLNLAGIRLLVAIALNQQSILIKPLKILVMKHKFFIVLLTCIISFSTFSCKKEQVNSPGSPDTGNSNGNTNTQLESLYFVANNWQLNPDGIYVHTFQTTMSANDVSRAKAYMSINGTYLLISPSIGYQNGTLWPTFSTTDVKINFRGSGVLPFTFLNIRVTFE